jgi:hypothetical protein
MPLRVLVTSSVALSLFSFRWWCFGLQPGFILNDGEITSVYLPFWCDSIDILLLPPTGELFIAMLTSVPSRLFIRRSRSLSPCSRVLQTSTSDRKSQGLGKTTDANRNPIVSTSRVSRKGILAEEPKNANVNPVVQYHHIAPRWLSNLENRRGSWAALASSGRNNSQYWEQSGRDGGGQGQGKSGGPNPYGLASAGVLSAAAVAFCLKKDSDNKGMWQLYKLCVCVCVCPCSLAIARPSSIVDCTLVWGSCCHSLQHKRRDQRA